MKVTILGCGSAAGVPSISSGWGACDPANAKNYRRRASILVEAGEAALLVDASPDLRAQLLDADVKHLDAVLFTHGHADHIHGVDELREINRLTRKPLSVFADAGTLRDLETRFGYAFEGIPEGKPFFRPWLVPQIIEAPENVEIAGLKIRTFVQDHGYTSTLGFRIGDFAYSTDLIDLPAESFAALEGLSVWVVGALGLRPYPTHAHLDKVLGWIERLKPRRAVITHMSNALDYESLVSKLPVGITPAFDGMQIDI